PHFAIYKPQLTWLSSIANRVTGVALSALLYGFSLTFVVALGTFERAHIVEFIVGLPDYVKYTSKAAPFTFFFWNALRHLS
ncbi:hypothetical protein CY34DRAFT_42164, partial [Suillus luteus UH-Slu-Lm8-n1]